MKCPQCGSRTDVGSTEHFLRENGAWLVRRRRACAKCNAGFFTAEVPIQEVVPDHPVKVSKTPGHALNVKTMKHPAREGALPKIT